MTELSMKEGKGAKDITEKGPKYVSAEQKELTPWKCKIKS